MCGLIEWPFSQKCMECKWGYTVLEVDNACACIKEGRCIPEPKEEKKEST